MPGTPREAIHVLGRKGEDLGTIWGFERRSCPSKSPQQTIWNLFQIKVLRLPVTTY